PRNCVPRASWLRIAVISASARSRSFIVPAYFTTQSTLRCRPSQGTPARGAAIHNRNVRNRRNRLGFFTIAARARDLEESMRFLVRTVLALVAASVTFCAAARAAEQVDLLLVLASDVSRSVDTRKFELQRQGYAAALSNPRVIDAIKSGPNGRIAICFVEWSG